MGVKKHIEKPSRKGVEKLQRGLARFAPSVANEHAALAGQQPRAFQQCRGDALCAACVVRKTVQRSQELRYLRSDSCRVRNHRQYGNATAQQVVHVGQWSADTPIEGYGG